MVFSTGTQVTLDEVLSNRELRANFIASRLLEHHEKVVLWVGCNIPGGIKNNDVITAFFTETIATLRAIFTENEIVVCDFSQWNKNTGPEAFFVFEDDPLKIKELTIDIEEQGAGRLLDLDVTYYDKKQAATKTVKRTALGYSPRRCLLCDDDAKVCGSRRLHPVEDLQAAVAQIINENK